MHSEQMELHLQHMIERAQMGMQGEEKEIEELLFDEVYTLVYTIYKDKEKTVFLSKGVLQIFRTEKFWMYIKMFRSMQLCGFIRHWVKRTGHYIQQLKI